MLAIVSKSYYHPDFRGSLSKKAALPVIVPALNCDDMKITDGGAAAPFNMRVLSPADAAERMRTFEEVRAYGARDSLARANLSRVFAALTQSNAPLGQCRSVSELGSVE